MPHRPLLPQRRSTPRGTVYVLHFDRPVGTERQQAQHYVGFTTDPDQRFEDHVRGNGARLVQVAMERGASIAVAIEIRGVDQTWEYRMKNRGSMRKVCPHCTGRPFAGQKLPSTATVRVGE